MTNISFIIHNADVQEKAHKEKGAPVTVSKVDCCQNFTDVKAPYYAYMPFDMLEHNKKLVEPWINLIKDTGFPVDNAKINDLVEPTVRKNIKYFNCPRFQTILSELNKLIKDGNNIEIKGTDRAGKVYRWTDTKLISARITGINLQEGLATIKVVNHKDSMLVGESFQVVLYYFDYLNDEPVMNMDELENELKANIIKYTPGYLVRINPVKMSPTIRMMTLTLVRYLWANNYDGLIKDFFKIQDEIPEGKFFEILLLASAKGNYGGGRGVYNFGDTLRSGASIGSGNNFPHFKDEASIWKDMTDGSKNVNGSVHGVPTKGYIAIKEFHDDLVNGRYRKAYGDMLFYSYGKKSNGANVAEALDYYGFLTQGKSYLVRGENDQSYKVIADDYSLRWYKKDRFKPVKTT